MNQLSKESKEKAFLEYAKVFELCQEYRENRRKEIEDWIDKNKDLFNEDGTLVHSKSKEH